MSNETTNSIISLFDTGNAILFKWRNDADWSVVYVSNNVEKLLGYSKEDLFSGKIKYASCISSEDLEKVSKEVQYAIDNKLEYFTHEPYRLITKTDETMWVLDHTVIERDEVGEITGFTGYITDITKQKLSEIALYDAKLAADRANEAKSNFLANMSHEIRTPLNAIIGLTEILQDSKLDPIQQDYLQRITNSSHSLLNVLNDILDYSKIEVGKLELVEQPFSLHETIKTATELFVHQIEAKGLQLKIDIDQNLPAMLVGDSFRLLQILNNLLGNALKFTHQGYITLAVKLQHKLDESVSIKFIVEDTGIGIAKDKQDKLFSPFTQEDSSTTRKYGGTGLGLMISKELVELMDGKIWFESSRGDGSSFYISFSFPYLSSEKLLQDTLHSNPEKNIFRLSFPKKALLVEDNETNQIVAETLLTRYGFEVSIANNGKEAIEKSAKKDFDIIFMDLHLPIIDGYEATREIREFNPSVPIIALSAATMQKDKDRAEEAGMDYHLAKPIDRDALERLIKNYFQLSEDSTHINDTTQNKTFESSKKLLAQNLLLDDDTIQKLFISFYDTYREKLDQLPSLLQTDPKTFYLLVHQIKGVSSNLYIEELAKLAAEIEEKKADPKSLENFLQCLKSVLEEIKTFI